MRKIYLCLCGTKVKKKGNRCPPCYYKTIKGIKRSEDTKRKMAESKWGERNPAWRGDNVGYTALHNWVRRRLPKRSFCSMCAVTPPIDLANVSGKYLRDLNDWEWLCRRCHQIKDGRWKNLVRAKKPEIPSPRRCQAAWCKNVGTSVVVHGLNAFLCETHRAEEEGRFKR